VRANGFYLKEWDLPANDKELTDQLEKSVIAYYTFRDGKGTLDFYFRILGDRLINSFLDSKIFSYLEILDPKSAIVWPFTDEKKKILIIKEAIRTYACKLADERLLLQQLYDGLTKIIKG
jgi:hypothetical protein